MDLALYLSRLARRELRPSSSGAKVGYAEGYMINDAGGKVGEEKMESNPQKWLAH